MGIGRMSSNILYDCWSIKKKMDFYLCPRNGKILGTPQMEDPNVV